MVLVVPDRPKGERLTEGGDSGTLLVSQPCWDWDTLIVQFYPVIKPNKFMGLPSWTEHSGLLVSLHSRKSCDSSCEDNVLAEKTGSL